MNLVSRHKTYSSYYFLRKCGYYGLLIFLLTCPFQITWAAADKGLKALQESVDNLSTQHDQLKNSISDLNDQHTELKDSLTNLSSQQEELLNAIANLPNPVENAGWQVSAIVDEDFCGGTIPTTPCSDGGTGHTRVPASSTNFNPVSIYILVQSADGKSVDFLPQDQILFENRLGPGDGVVPCGDSSDTRGCVEQFGGLGNGQYVIYVHPAVTNWRAESYHFSITVFDEEGEVKGRTIGQINIPN